MSIEYETKRFEIGDVVFQQGTEPDGFYVLQKGRVEIVVDGPNGSRVSLAYVEEGDPFGEMSIVDATRRTASAIACASCVAMFFPREMLDKELKRAELITYLFRNVCRKLADQNQEFSHHNYVDLQSSGPARAEYHANLSLEPISARMERYVGVKRLGVPRLPFIVGNGERGSAIKHTDTGFWFDAAKIKEFKTSHFRFVRQENQFFVSDLSGTTGTLVNDTLCQAGGTPTSVPLRRGFNQITIPGRGADFGFLAYVH
jgi:hypothetical protein